jgi:hypothetical protein
MTIIKPLGLIIGVDPGDSMGIFALKLHEKHAERMHFLQTDVSTAVNWLEETLYAANKSSEGALVACERYTVTPETGKRTQQPTALQAIGIVKILIERFSTRFVMMPPGDVKAFAPNEMLKRLGFYTTPKEVNLPDANDVNDAARHATLALARFKASIFDAMLANSGV